MALAVVGGIHELVLQAIEQESVHELHMLVAPASACCRRRFRQSFNAAGQCPVPRLLRSAVRATASSAPPPRSARK